MVLIMVLTEVFVNG